MTFVDFPFGIDSRGRTAVTDDDDHVRDLIEQVLFTEPLERPNRPDFGCGLRSLVFEGAGDALVTATQALVHSSLQRWLEREIVVEAVRVEAGAAGEGSLVVTVAYQRRATGAAGTTQVVRLRAPGAP